jgi:hypothetical protein
VIKVCWVADVIRHPSENRHTFEKRAMGATAMNKLLSNTVSGPRKFQDSFYGRQCHVWAVSDLHEVLHDVPRKQGTPHKNVYDFREGKAVLHLVYCVYSHHTSQFYVVPRYTPIK